MSSGGAPAAFHVMAKPAGARCNLACEYCFYLDKIDLYPGSGCRMSERVLRSFIQQYLEAQRVPQATLAWQGGEPTLMGIEFFRSAVEHACRSARRGMVVRHTIQTNGTMLDEAWCRFFRKHGFLVGISIDGPPEIHDAFRVDRSGRGSSERVLAGARLLREHAVEFNVLAAVHRANQDHPREVYRFLRDRVGARFIQFIPIVEGERRVGPHLCSDGKAVRVEARKYGRFLNAVFDEWVRRDVGRVFVQAFDDALAAWYGRGDSVCVLAPTCGTALALEHNGDLYACDHYVEPGYLLGNITEVPLIELVASERLGRFGSNKRNTLARSCHDCRFLFACHGGCPRHRFAGVRGGDAPRSYLCAGYRDYFAHVDRPMRSMVDLLRRGRAPAEIMLRPSGGEVGRDRRTARPGRNDPCPCGSGLKLKRCHGRSGGGAAALRGNPS